MANKKTETKETKEYVLKMGHIHHGFKDGNRHEYVGGQKDNDRVHLTDTQYHAFRDKFESVEEQKERMKLQSEVAKLKENQTKLEQAAAEKGISVDELLGEITAKKPDPTPSVGTSEPTPTGVTPAPTGSTANPAQGTQTASSSGGNKK